MLALGRPALPALVLAAGVCAAAVGARPAAAPAVTFARDVAPILFARCAPCHRPGGAAPFPLLSYKDARTRADLIADLTAKRLMPPWPPEPGYGEFAGARRLSDAELDVIQRWVEAGAPEGNRADLPPAPAWPEGWQLGKPDLIVTMPDAYTLPPDGPDVFQKLVLPIPVSGRRYVKALEFRPGNARVVHHAIMHVDRTGSARGAAHAAGAEPGRGGMIFTEGETPDGHFLGWSPGEMPAMGREELAWPLDQGTDLLLQLHLMPTGKPETIRASVGFFFTDAPPSRVGLGLQLGSYVIDILPGDKQYTVEDRYVLPVDVEAYAIYPHAHYLGREIAAHAVLPDGTTRWLVWIKDWNFDWQGEYRYARPVDLPKGTTLVARFTYDNSSDNPRNPNRPPARVRYGGRSSDEMANVWLQVVPRSGEELPALRASYARKAAARDAAGYVALLAADPQNAAIHRGLGLAYLRAGRAREAIAHLTDALRLGGADAAVHYHLGNAEAARGNVAGAVGHFRQAIAIQPALAEAYNNLGVMLQSEGDLDEPARLYREALAIKPAYAEAHNNLGVMLQAGGKLEEAIAHFREAVRLDPDYALARENLAAALRIRR
jgi:Flp pilus assembly protein TadD/mono/diheme cytochrome c family protein